MRRQRLVWAIGGSLFGLVLVGCAVQPPRSSHLDEARSSGSAEQLWQQRASALGAAVQDLVACSSSVETTPPRVGGFTALVVGAQTNPPAVEVDPVGSPSTGVPQGEFGSPYRNASSRTLTLTFREDATIIVYPSRLATATVSPAGYRPSLALLEPADLARVFHEDALLREELSGVGAYIAVVDGEISSLVSHYSP